MIFLSKRLAAVAEYVLRDEPVADIGTDHALLPVYLVERGIVPRAVAGDVNPGPVQAARKQVRDAGLSERIDVRQGNGLDVLRPGEAATVVMAGMGGGTMTDILSFRPELLLHVKRLVLQPNIGEPKVREWLVASRWKLVSERLLEEHGIFYEVLVADAAGSAEEADLWNEKLYAGQPEGPGRVSSSLLLLLGPFLSKQSAPPYMRKWEGYLRNLEDLIERMKRSGLPETERKRERMEEERDELKEWLLWLSRSER